MKTVRRVATKPYCTCSKDRSEGWSRQGEEWIHPGCGKVAKAVWLLHDGFPVGMFP